MPIRPPLAIPTVYQPRHHLPTGLVGLENYSREIKPAFSSG